MGKVEFQKYLAYLQACVWLGFTFFVGRILKNSLLTSLNYISN